MKSNKNSLTGKQSSKSSRFKEDDIRPKKFEAEQRAAFMADIALLLRERDGFESVPCPACGTDDCEEKFEKYGFSYVECRKCSTLYMNPRPTPLILEKYYRKSVAYDYWSKYIFPTSEKVRREKIFVPRVDKILDFCERYKVAKGAILEIGAAFGTFCEEMRLRKYFKRVVALEPTPSLADILRNKGIETVESNYENADFGKDKFDAIVSFEVLEHLFSPTDFLKKCRSLLRPGGLIVLTCPNYHGFDFLVLGKECNSIDHEHLNYFNPESISLLAEKAGFDTLEVVTPGRLDAELVRNKMLGDKSVKPSKFFEKVLIDRFDEIGGKFQDFLAENRLSSSLWMVARKTG